MSNTAQPRSGLEVAQVVWHRRKWLALLVFAIPFAAVAGATRTLPDIFESTATILVEQQQGPERLVGPSGAGALKTRLGTISEQILSRSRLHDLIVRFDLYPKLRPQATVEALAERMRRDIWLDFNEVRDTTVWRDTMIAFTISYRGQDPQRVAQVANALAELYVVENARILEQAATGTVEFLRAQLEEATRQLGDQERRMIEFKNRHIGELPEQQATNLAALERLNAQLRVISDKELRAIERRDDLAREMSASPGAGDPIAGQLARLRQELVDLRTRYTDEHPDIVRVKAEVAALEQQLARRATARGGPAAPNGLARVEQELVALRNEEQALRRAIATYERRIENAPRLEQELQQISRDHAGAKERYGSLLKRYEDAQLAERIEQRLQGEQFRILDPAVPAQEPVAPRRFRFLLMGLMMSMVAAAGASLLAETRDTSFHTVNDLRAFTSVPVLVSIPPISTKASVRLHYLRFGLGAVAAAIAVTAVAAGSAYLARSNDLLLRFLAPGL